MQMNSAVYRMMPQLPIVFLFYLGSSALKSMAFLWDSKEIFGTNNKLFLGFFVCVENINVCCYPHFRHGRVFNWEIFCLTGLVVDLTFWMKQLCSIVRINDDKSIYFVIISRAGLAYPVAVRNAR